MEYITSKELSIKWGISQRRIIYLANEGRIKGAKIFGKTWVFPSDAIKPTNNTKEKIKEEYNFRYPNFAFKDLNSFNPPLTEEELIIKSTFEFAEQFEFKKANIILGNLDQTASNIYIKITATYLRCMIDIFTSNPKRFLFHYSNLTNLFNDDFPYKVEMEQFVYLIDSFLGSNTYYAKEFKIKSDYPYHPSFLPKLASIVTINLTFINPDTNLNELNEFELNLKLLENTDNYDDLIQIHTNLACCYSILGNKDNMKYHLIKALDLIKEHKIYFHFCLNYYYFSKAFKETLSLYPIEFQNKITSISNEIHLTCLKFLNELSLNSFYYSLQSKDYIFVFLTIKGLTNKEIAAELNISPSNVAKHFTEIYESLGVKNKAEMIDLFNKNTNKSLLNDKNKIEIK